MKIAICSPNKSAYSETFIHAHKNLLMGTILYYNTGYIPTQLESNSILPSGKYYNIFFRILFRKFNFLKYSDNQMGFYKSLKKEKPHVILAEYAVCGAEIFSIAQKINIPLVIHCHGFDVSDKPIIQTYGEKYKEAFAYANAVIGVSKQMCSKLEELGCPKEKIVYSCYGPHPEFFEVNPGFKNPIALSVGRFVEKKAPYLTLLAFTKVLEKIPNAKLRMIGDGLLLPVCKDLVRALKIESSVTFLGSMNQKEVKNEMDLATLFVQHSKTGEDGDMEGTPVAIIEAQAAGLPVVSTYHAGIPDIVINDKTGFLSAEGEIDAMANNMIRLLSDKILCEEMGKNARERVKNNFTMEKHINLLQTVLSNAAKR
jgi:colanic acid/amylovoran biosynthesis glycosyltransferase